MDGSGRRKGSWRCRAVAVALGLAAYVPAAWGADLVANARLSKPDERFALSLAIQDAARQLAHPKCQGLLDEFSDASGRALRAALETEGVTPAEYLDRLFFYDARPAACEGGRLAMTTPGSRVILVCGRTLARSMRGNRRHVEAIIIHETLHSLGLGENPPSSDHITSRVLASCGQTGEVASIAKASQTQPATSAAAVPDAVVASR